MSSPVQAARAPNQLQGMSPSPVQPFQGLPLRHRVIAVVLSGILLIFCFPKFDWAVLAWVALVPMLAAIEGVSPRRSFWLGGLTGMVGYTGIVYWVTITMTRYGGVPLPVSWVIMLMLAAYISLYAGAFCALLSRFGRENAALRFVLAPFLWTTLELARTYFLTGFPWASLGYSQYTLLPAIQMADITGVYGVGFLIILANAALWFAIRSFWPGLPKQSWKGTAWALGISVLLIGGAFLYGQNRLQAFRTRSPGGAPANSGMKVALLQGNIEQGLKWDKAYREQTLNVYWNLTHKYAKEKPDLIVWPETAAPFFFSREKALQKYILDLAADVGTPLLVGAPSVVRVGRVFRLRNSAFQVTPEKRVDGEYHKMHLVPYGEFVPLKRFFPFIQKMVTGIGDFLPGETRTVFPHPKAPFGVLICYEVIFPNEVRQSVRGGAKLLVNITNDAWFGRSAAAYQHLAMTALRAVENRVPLVRAANTGITAAVDPSGQIREATNLFVRAGVVTNVYPESLSGMGMSFYTRFGDIFAYLCVVVTLLIFAFTWQRSRSE